MHKNTLHQPQITNSLRDTRNNFTHMVFECDLSVKLHAKDVDVGLAIKPPPGHSNQNWESNSRLSNVNEERVAKCVVRRAVRLGYIRLGYIASL